MFYVGVDECAVSLLVVLLFVVVPLVVVLFVVVDVLVLVYVCVYVSPRSISLLINSAISILPST